jgi:16S rRNA (uracil1498-N3)-methyltransferase
MSGRRISQLDKDHQSHIILIGPEGGFSGEEIDLIGRYNWNIISLGDRILRTETASMVAQTILRDF